MRIATGPSVPSTVTVAAVSTLPTDQRRSRVSSPRLSSSGRGRLTMAYSATATSTASTSRATASGSA